MNPDKTLFDAAWAAAPAYLQCALKDFAKYPTSRNSCFITGYLTALNNSGVLEQQAYSYLLGFTGRLADESELQKWVLG